MHAEGQRTVPYSKVSCGERLLQASEPKRVSSTTSSGVTVGNSRAVGILVGSAVKIPSTSFQI